MTIVNSSPADTRRMLRDLAPHIAEQPGFRDVVAELRAGGSATVEGLWGSAGSLITAALLTNAPERLVVVWPNQDAADRSIDELSLFADVTPLCLPASDPGGLGFDPTDDVHGQRLRTLKMLANSGAGPTAPPERLLVTSMPSILQPVPNPQTLVADTKRWQVGQSIDIEPVRRWLTEHGFHATSEVQLPGEFSARGGILDVFAVDSDHPVRIELFGDEIESIRFFDVTTQRSAGTCDGVEISVYPTDQVLQNSIFDYLSDQTWFVLIEPETSRTEVDQYWQRLPEGHNCLEVELAFRELMRRPLALATNMASSPTPVTCQLAIGSVERFSGEITRVREELQEVAQGDHVLIVAATEAEHQRLSEVFQSMAIATAGRLHFVVGVLHAGFRLASAHLVLISGAELFQRTDRPRMPRRQLGRAIDSFMELAAGDLVVHVGHGVGRYRGMRVLTKGAHVEEHLEVEFHGGVTLFVPASRIDLVQKYVGGSHSRPRLARIGAKSWARQKQAAENAVTDLAAEMLELQAARAARPGIAFAADSQWQFEFDASFAYDETPDQSHAIQSVHTDMLAPQPMDRLLCGDVGFGKTEVAMRAAFKAVDSGYQAAILVPTTILAEQHYRTFQQRMAEFPVDIGRLSRFASARQQREILDGLRRGRIDIVIGTHRLVSADVRFHNLGLVIIDEEQRFGVEVKEHLKQLRTTVDVLTMTATPIPRTLHMSLVGVRDISNLETPPAERMAIQTRVSRFDKHLIREAILRELNRGGQVFFVHNRVHSIQRVAERLAEIVPEASIRIGHGQMRESELEQVMIDFVDHQFDVLLATTIVESGLDIPNANTIFIDDADRYGLADLHQLRGRVGRYKHRAYCYLLIDPARSLTPNAARRLRAIEEFSSMGAGFAIAMRDLEIRGAGNLLGTQQSGHITAVGYELYCQLLENAVRRQQRLPVRQFLDVDIQLPGEAHLPTEFVPDLRAKVDLYRRFTRVTCLEELAQLRQEIRDRFGPPPPPVDRMIAMVKLKIAAAQLQVKAIHIEQEYLVFEFTNSGPLHNLAQQFGRRLRVVDQRTAYLPISKALTQSPEILDVAKSVLQADGDAVYNLAPQTGPSV